ncbi:hypothetical protein QFC20_000932 [Naganishia adeliensis]|uniref:Uncharacterized protein n=1 Tax=Naganishia adeliensis TaxID=92952 RepID=A0ACC2WYL2_9TREE|nr:hypothetical protein QFC20_000932 [Naganishia adeliensis]
MSNANSIPSIIKETREAAGDTPAESVEPRQVTTTDGMHPDPFKSIKLPPNRQALVDDVIALYSCQPTIERVSRYAPNCIYDDQKFVLAKPVRVLPFRFVYANNRYKMAGQWFALPQLFPASKNEGYEIIKNEPTLIQFKNEQTWTMPILHNNITINALVSLELDPATADSDFPLIDLTALLHNLGFGFAFKKSQADIVARIISDENVQYFKGDDIPDQPVVKHGSGTNAPMKDY